MKAFSFLLAMSLALGAAAADVYQRIIAKVGSEIITSYDVDSAIQILEDSMGQSERESEEGKKKLKEARKKYLDHLIAEKLVVLAAEKGPEGFKEALERGTAPANPYLPTSFEVEEEVDKTFEEARSRMGSQERFEEELKKERISVSEFRQRLRESLRSRMTVSRMQKMKEKEFQPALRVSDEEAKAFYDEHKSSFAVGEQANLRHILYKDRAAAEAAASSLRASRRKKEDFIALAKKESKDEPTAAQGGRLGWIEKGGLRWKEVEQKAFSATPGEIVGPVRSEDGWHLLLVEEKKPGEQKGFEEVKAQVRNYVYQQKMQARMEQWIEDLKREFYVERSEG